MAVCPSRNKLNAKGSKNFGAGMSAELKKFIALFMSLLSVPSIAFADQGGVSYWIPGFFGSLAAAPQQPGWSLTNIDY